MNESPFQKNKKNKIRKNLNSERGKLPALQGNNIIKIFIKKIKNKEMFLLQIQF